MRTPKLEYWQSEKDEGALMFEAEQPRWQIEEDIVVTERKQVKEHE